MKYTIELTDNQKKQMDLLCEIANRHIGFNPKLEMDIPIPIKQSPAYDKGFEDGKKWAIDENAKDNKGYYDNGYNDALEDVNHAMTVLEKMTETEREKWFEDYASVGEVVCGFTVQRIVEIIKAYEEKKTVEEEDIKVGDIIYSGMTDTKAIIISFDAWDNWNCIDSCGTGFTIDVSKMEFWKKIGHIDEIGQVLDKLRGEE